MKLGVDDVVGAKFDSCGSIQSSYVLLFETIVDTLSEGRSNEIKVNRVATVMMVTILSVFFIGSSPDYDNRHE